MIKNLLLLSVFIVLLNFSWAKAGFIQQPYPYMPIYMDLSSFLTQDPNTDGNLQTGLFTHFKFEDETASTFSTLTLQTGTSFVDKGYARVTDLVNGTVISDTEGLTTNWELTFYWNNLYGTIDKITSSNVYSNGVDVVFSYVPGTTIYMDIDTTPDADFGQISPPDGNVSGINDSTDTDVTKVLQGQIIAGGGYATFIVDSNGNIVSMISRTISFLVDVSISQSGLFFNSNNQDLTLLPIVIAWGQDSTTGTSYSALDLANKTLYGYSDDGEFGFSTPEPASILLLGGGLFVIGVIGRKRLSK